MLNCFVYFIFLMVYWWCVIDLVVVDERKFVFDVVKLIVELYDFEGEE